MHSQFQFEAERDVICAMARRATHAQRGAFNAEQTDDRQRLELGQRGVGLRVRKLYLASSIPRLARMVAMPPEHRT